MAMHTWFECKIGYEKTMENGMKKKVTEPDLVDALSFTEAEARISEEMTPFISGEFTVSDRSLIHIFYCIFGTKFFPRLYIFFCAFRSVSYTHLKLKKIAHL